MKTLFVVAVAACLLLTVESFFFTPYSDYVSTEVNPTIVPGRNHWYLKLSIAVTFLLSGENDKIQVPDLNWTNGQSRNLILGTSSARGVSFHSLWIGSWLLHSRSTSSIADQNWNRAQIRSYLPCRRHITARTAESTGVVMAISAK